MPITFHILDAFARDEKIISENENEKLVQFERNEEDDDDEFKPSYKSTTVPKGKIDHSNKKVIVHLFGKTVDGKPVRCDVKGFKPFFFLRAPEGPKAVQEGAKKCVRDYLRRHLTPEGILKTIEVESCTRRELFGYTQDKKVPMIRITMPSLGLFREVKNLFVNSKWEPQLKLIKGRWNQQERKYEQVQDVLGLPFSPDAPTVYEANLDPMLRFFHLRNLKPCNWATVDGIDYNDEVEENGGLFECDWEDVCPCETPPAATAPFSVISWDIECMSVSGGFPVATKNDPVIQIGSIVSRLGSKETEKHIFVLGTCDTIPEGTVYTFKTERDLLLGWFRWLSTINPDILIGYNTFGFDEKYVWERADKLGITTYDEVQCCNKLYEEGEQMKLDEKRLSSSAMGDNFLYLWNTVGRLRVDLYQYIKRGYPLPSYKLDDTSRNFLGESVKEIEQKVDAWCLTIGSTKQDVAVGRNVVLLNAAGDTLCEKVDVISVEDGSLTITIPEDVIPEEVAKWAVVKDDVTPKEMFKMHLGSSADRAIIARYCVQDCQLVLDLFRKLEVFNNSMSMANVCSVPVSYIFLRGQGIKIESLMFKYCYEREQCIVCLPSGGGNEETYEGAIVLDPTPGFYTTPVGVADFASLYPSTIISENISHDTLVWVKDFAEDGTLLRFVYGSDDYDNLPGVSYTDIEYDNMIDDPEDTRKAKRKIKDGTRVCRYAQDRIGTIPQIVGGLLAARKAKRNEAAKESDAFKVALLDAEQLAYKLTANSLYGQLGSGTFKIRMRPLAASVTAYGRKQILFAKAVIESVYGREAKHPHCSATADTVYGDSVTGDTPVFLRKKGGQPFLTRLDELANFESAVEWHTTKETVELSDTEIWTEKGWTSVQRIIRHRLAPGKKMFRILTHTGIVDCTEDHSLVLANGTETKPTDIVIGTELLHTDSIWKEFKNEPCSLSVDEAWAMGLFLADGIADSYKFSEDEIVYDWSILNTNKKLLEKAASKLQFQTEIIDRMNTYNIYYLNPIENDKELSIQYRKLFYNANGEKRIPSSILNAPIEIVESFLDGFYAGDGDKYGQKVGNYRWDQKGKEVNTGLILLAQRLGYSISLNDREDKHNVFRITCTKASQRKNPIAIKSIRDITSSFDTSTYVYDLQTDNHHFAVGPGHLVVHNTDSLFIAFNPKNPETGEQLQGREAVEKTIHLTEEAGKLVSKALKKPHDFEFDKVYWPFIIFSKKRYVGHKYEDPDHPDKFKLAFMGVALKRRDYAAIVKRMYSGALTILLNERNVPKAAELIQQMAVDLVEGKYGLQPLTISKSLRADYNSIPAHKMLADRIAARDPGNAPASGDRIPFIYVQPQVGQQAPDLQGDRIETPGYIREKGLKPDYMYYIDHQIANPVCQLFGIVVDQIPGFAEQNPPRGGWSEDPEKLAIQRETIAYNLLFQRAIDSYNRQRVGAFASMLGATTMSSTSTSTRSTRLASSIGTSVPSIPKTIVKQQQQNTLDSMFMAQMKVNAVHDIIKKKKAEEKAIKELEKKKKEEEEKKASGQDEPSTKPKRTRVSKKTSSTVVVEDV